jgi:hypothetical protein
VTIGRVVWRGTQAALALALVVLGLTWLNLVASSVLSVGGSCSSGGPYVSAAPCPGGAWMAPVGIFVALAGLGLYLLRRPAGSPQLVLFAWPALFGSLGIQFLRAAAAETGAYGWWLCGVVFLLMAAAPLALVLAGDRASLRRALLGDGWAEPEGTEETDRPRIARSVPDGSVTGFAPLGPVGGNGNGNGSSSPAGDGDDLAESLSRLSRLHRDGDLSDAEFAEAKQKVLDGA